MHVEFGMNFEAKNNENIKMSPMMDSDIWDDVYNLFPCL